MDAELARKLPAQIVKVSEAPRLPRIVRWRAPVESALVDRVNAYARAGRIGRTYRMGRDDRGWWADVTLLAEAPRARPRWVKPLAIVCTAAVVLTGAAWAAVLALRALAALLPVLAVGAVGLIVLRLLTGSSISVTQVVKISRW